MNYNKEDLVSIEKALVESWYKPISFSSYHVIQKIPEETFLRMVEYSIKNVIDIVEGRREDLSNNLSKRDKSDLITLYNTIKCPKEELPKLINSNDPVARAVASIRLRKGI